MFLVNTLAILHINIEMRFKILLVWLRQCSWNRPIVRVAYRDELLYQLRACSIFLWPQAVQMNFVNKFLAINKKFRTIDKYLLVLAASCDYNSLYYPSCMDQHFDLRYK